MTSIIIFYLLHASMASITIFTMTCYNGVNNYFNYDMLQFFPLIVFYGPLLKPAAWYNLSSRALLVVEPS